MPVLFLSALLTVISLNAANAGSSPALVSTFEVYFEHLVNGLEAVFFYKVFGFPILVLWLVLGGVFFTIATGCVNVRLLGHAFGVTRGKYSQPTDPGQITHFQALATSISGTVGLGNIAGVSTAVALGGPGAVVWMMIAGIFGMATKFAEATLGHKFRKIDHEGRVSAGAFIYLREGLTSQGFGSLSAVLSVLFAICCLGGALGAGNMFQSNQTVAILSATFMEGSDLFGDMDAKKVVAAILAVLVGIVLIGGIGRIASTAEMIVPAMAVIYLCSCVVILVINASEIGDAISVMFSQAMTGSALSGGLLGAIIVGFQRSAFSNEAGIGSASIVHPTARNREPVRAGCTALLETFVDTMVICFMTGLVITVSGVYKGVDANAVPGIEIAGNAFSTVADWFPMVLSICVLFFAFSTMITWSYYGERAWSFLFRGKLTRLYQIIFCALVFFGGATDEATLVLKFSDLLLFSMAIPNMIGLYMMSGLIRREVSSYIERMKKGGAAFHNNAASSA